MRRLRFSKFVAGSLLLLAAAVVRGQAISPLFARGFTVIPEPRQVKLEANDFRIGGDWHLEIGGGVTKSSAAGVALIEDLESRFSLRLKTEGGGPAIHLEIAPGSVHPGPAQDRDTEAISAQAYRLELSPAAIRIAANAEAGLFYGVETLVQLTKRSGGALWLPAGEIVDWPDLELRQIYWDDAHHLERLSDLKHAVRQAAFYKANGFAIKLEGHFQYRSAPALVEPYALTPAEFQELTDYGLRYQVQVIPYLDGPAHIAFILKHPEYVKLREFPDSNYELCATNPDAIQLMLSMFGDLIAANRGVKPIILSTDEPYYVGMADNAQCREAAHAKELGSVGRVLDEFVTKVGSYLHDRGRTVIFWGEYPLIPADIADLPPFVVNGETYGPDFDPLFRAHGIRQMIYTSTEGMEPFFPDYFRLPLSRRIHRERGDGGRVAGAVAEIVKNPARRNADLMGTLVAGWGDMGLHPEAFWLGYATITAAAWNPDGPDPREAMSAFYPLYYGSSVRNMDRVYQLMSFQAQVWLDTWDRMESHARKPIWGNSDKIFQPPHPAHDQTVPIPKGPGENDLAYDGTWSQENAKRLEAAEGALPENDELIGLLQENLPLAEQNRYGLEVFLAIARLFRQNLTMLESFARIDAALSSAHAAAKEGKDHDAVVALDQALEIARSLRHERNQALREAIATWYKTWYPRVAEANGRQFLHDLDDVKDHLPDRTVDMSYLVYDELQLPLDDWYDRTQSARNSYATQHHLPALTAPLNWRSIE
jgi:hexosaminidase